MLKKTLVVAALATLLGACSSTALDPAPAANPNASTLPGQAGGASQSRVAPVAVQQNAGDAQGPLGASRLVYFDYDSHTIRPEFRSLLDTHAKYLRSNTARKVVIEGHTDERGG